MTGTATLSPQLRTAMVARVVGWYRRSTPDQRAAGLGWYAEAFRQAERICPGNPELAAGVIAALSPRCQWSTNVLWTEALVMAAMRGNDVPPPVHTTVMRGQAWRIAHGAPALDVLNGPKVRAFFANITGDTDAVTVDVWAMRAAMGPHTPANGALTPAVYAQVADVYRRAAAQLGITPRECQAAVWVAIRGTRPTDAGFHADAAGRAA